MNLENIRRKIDSIDLQVLGLLEERMELALRTRRLKTTTQDSNREEVVLERARDIPLALLESNFVDRLYRFIIEESKRLQDEKRTLVAFQGEHGAYSEMAARNLVPSGAFIPCPEFSDVFRGVENGDYDLAVVPVENSLEGAVTQVNQLLTSTELLVVGEAIVPIGHCLMAGEDQDCRELRVVYSHPQALGQCRDFLQYNKLEPRPYYDTAGAAKMIARNRPHAAGAIANPLCAELYGLSIIKERIGNDSSNSTRFLLLSREPASGAGDKCSLVFSTNGP